MMFRLFILLPILSFFLMSCNEKNYIRFKNDEIIKTDTNIIIINVGKLDRGKIGVIIDELYNYNPKVIGIDIFFAQYYGEYKDTTLVRSLKKCINCVIVCKLEFKDKKFQKMIVTSSHPNFSDNKEQGFTNHIKDDDNEKLNNKYKLKISSEGDDYLHFAAAVAMKFDSLRTINFLKKYHNAINFKFLCSPKPFKIIEWGDVLKENFKELNRISNKIVLLGFTGPGKEDYSDDIPFDVYIKCDIDGIYGVVFLGQMISQILSD